MRRDTREVRVRWVTLGAAVLTVAVGVVGRRLPVVGDPLGGVAYVVLIALLVLLVRPRTTAWTAAASGTAIGVGVELLQLTPVPGVLTSILPPLRWVLGSTFAWTDLLWYALGGVIAYGIAAVITRTRDLGAEAGE